MKKESFDFLVSWITEKIFLKIIKIISIEEQLVMFLMIFNQGLSNWAIQERFPDSGATVSRSVF
jgi:hypothetical protein